MASLVRYNLRNESKIRATGRGTAMSTTTRVTAQDEIDYPESDGEPVAENTLQFKWIELIKGGLDIVF